MTTLKKILINIALGFIPSSKKRKELRQKYINSSVFTELTNIIDGNRLIIIKPDGSISNENYIQGLNISFIGSNSKVILHEPIQLYNCNINIKDNCHIEIQSSPFGIHNLNIDVKDSSKVTIGKNFACNGCHIENHDEKAQNITIGNDCLFSYGITIRPSDGHVIYNKDTMEILNRPMTGITIGDHVWIGMETIILKDVNIPSNTIIGAKSLVNKGFKEEYTIIAGIPAKTIKHNTNWHINNCDAYKTTFVATK